MFRKDIKQNIQEVNEIQRGNKENIIKKLHNYNTTTSIVFGVKEIRNNEENM